MKSSRRVIGCVCLCLLSASLVAFKNIRILYYGFGDIEVDSVYDEEPSAVVPLATNNETLPGYCAVCDSLPLPPAVDCPVYKQAKTNGQVNADTEWYQDISVWRQQHPVSDAPSGLGRIKYLVSAPIRRDDQLWNLTEQWRCSEHSILDQSKNPDAIPLEPSEMARRVKELSDNVTDPLMLLFTLNGRYPVGSVNLQTPSISGVLGAGIRSVSWRSLSNSVNVDVGTPPPDFKRPNWGTYGPVPVIELAKLLQKYPVKGKHTLVIGSQSPWIEYELLAAGAKHVTTSEYSQLAIPDGHPRMSRVHPDQLGSLVGQFDLAATYSSLEHAGLGRYGDPLDPNGDLKEMAKISCLLKPGGLLLLGFPVHADCMLFNLHRVYGPLRMALMTECYRAVDVSKVTWSPCQGGNATPQTWMVFQNMRGCAI